jgi:hypothetical protein
MGSTSEALTLLPLGFVVFNLNLCFSFHINMYEIFFSVMKVTIHIYNLILVPYQFEDNYF